MQILLLIIAIYVLVGIDLSESVDASMNHSLTNYIVNGTITTLGCHIINGDMTNQTTSMSAVQICHYKNSYFQIKEIPPNTGCTAVLAYWKDPLSGHVFTFPDPCVAPQFYDVSKGNVTSAEQIKPAFHLDSPLKQFVSGIPAQTVECASDFQLILKAEDGSPACVEPDTAQKLVKRGWGTLHGVQTFFPSGNTNSKNSNPLGVTALVEYVPINMNWNSGPNYHFYLKITSNSTAYLLGYDICGKDFCVKNNTLSVLLPITKLQIANYTQIGLSDTNHTWTYGDTVNMQIEVSPSLDNKTAYFLEFENSKIVP